MKANHPTKIIKRQKLISVLQWLSRRAFLFFCGAAVYIFATGCGPLWMRWNVDPEFARTHDLNFKQPLTKPKAVLLYEHKGKDTLHKEPFLEAMKNSGAFSEVAVVEKERDLQKYEGWNVIRVQLTYLGAKSGLTSAEGSYQVKIRLEWQTPGQSIECVYTNAIWSKAGGIMGGKTPTDEAHKPTAPFGGVLGGGPAQVNELFAQEMIAAAFSEAQRSGRYFQ